MTVPQVHVNVTILNWTSKLLVQKKISFVPKKDVSARSLNLDMSSMESLMVHVD